MALDTAVAEALNGAPPTEAPPKGPSGVSASVADALAGYTPSELPPAPTMPTEAPPDTSAFSPDPLLRGAT